MSQQPDLLAPLHAPSVLALLGECELRRGGDFDRLNMPTMAACRKAMETRLQQDPRFADWQAVWQRALSDCQPEVFGLARQAVFAAADRLPPSLYAMVWRHEASFRDVDANAPRLVPLLAIAIAYGWRPDSHRTLESLKQSILDLPYCKPATWRWLLQHGTEPLRPFLATLEERPWSTVAAFLSLWIQSGLPPPLSPAITEEWASSLKRPRDLEFHCPQRMAMIARHAATLDKAQQTQQTSEILAAIQLAAQSPLPILDRNQQRAGWPWLRKELRQQRCLQLVDEGVMSRLRASLPATLSIGDYEFVILRSKEEIEEEGRRMDHCMNGGAEEFLQDGRLHFSVRCTKNARSLATCSLVGIGEQLAPTDVYGFDNATASGALRSSALQLASNAQMVRLLKSATY
ncbi:MAG: hypothetical protein ACXIUB_08960 [Wenzhouxiangella sp.]